MGLIGPRETRELKLELIPNDVKLEGSRNYLSWARRVQVILGGKGVEHYPEEDCVEPANKLSPEWRVRHTTDSTIVAWLLASMSPSVGKMVEAMHNAAQIWKYLSNMYSKRGNVMVMMEIQNKADAVKQAGRPVEQTGRVIGTGVGRNGLWFINQAESALAAEVGVKEREIFLLHRRLGHMTFENLNKLYPDAFKGVDRTKLVCDACELGKHTRTTYPSIGLRSCEPFMLIHSDVWGPCSITSLSGFKGFVTFIDCYTRMTWVYMLRGKHEVLRCFQDFHKLVANQFNAKVRILRTDNGKEYVNNDFGAYLSDNGIIHQTTVRIPHHECSKVNDVSMNVPKYLWSEAVLTAAYLINRMPSRILGMKSPSELLDYRPSVGKLDPRSVKCVFVGYSSTQKGYKCWDPIGKKLFVSMDVTFRELEPYYTKPWDLDPFFEEFSSITEGDSREGENDCVQDEGTGHEGACQGEVVVGAIPCPMNVPMTHEVETQDNVVEMRSDDHENEEVTEDMEMIGDKDREVIGEESEEVTAGANIEQTVVKEPIVYRRRLGRQGETGAKEPIVYRRRRLGSRGEQVDHDIANFISYSRLSPAYKAFVASLQTVPIPSDWKCAKQDPKWNAAMKEEMHALQKNKTWELVPLPKGKKAVGCKWVFTVKQNPKGEVDRYKARLVAKGYSQTYGIDYDETFAPVAKMNTVRTLISCAVNFGWPLHQMDVKNAFLHGDLQEEVYMEIPPGFAGSQTIGKVCKLNKSLYGLKQSPRAWFDRFRRAVCDMGYTQCNGDHTVFYKHGGMYITIMAVYVDDIVITGDDVEEIKYLKENLGRIFEVKDLGPLRYFLGIEIARSLKGIVLSQRKYVLDLLEETGMLGCRPCSTPIDKNHQINAEFGDPVNKETYQRLVGRLIYLCHTRPDISYAVSVVSRYMHDPRTGHMDVVYRILRYLKGTPGRGLWYKRNAHLNLEGYCDADWASSKDDRRSTSGYCVFVGGNLVSWRSKKQAVVARSTAEAEYRAMALSLCEMLWLKGLLKELRLLRNETMTLHCDNVAAMNIANNPVQFDRTKHVEIDRFFIKEKLDSGTLKLKFVKSKRQLADCFTKGLGPSESEMSCNKMGMLDIFSPS
ncbi:hypothetical protein U9M48_041533 [Paspalum notatum var. saurae]|uniref:Integrase catalytic domain-containing protein n=1 Tax=Paspalum notatum var. saurae TaxID=547442 RepID=A0AAQ3XGM3_PASNO